MQTPQPLWGWLERGKESQGSLNPGLRYETPLRFGVGKAFAVWLAPCSFALFSNAPHLFDFLDVGKGVGCFASCVSFIDSDLSDFLSGGVGFFCERWNVATYGDDESVYGGFDFVALCMDFFHDSIHEGFKSRHLYFFI